MIDYFSNIYPTRHPNKTFRWFNSDVPESYDSKNSIYSPEAFNYTFNELGFRCDSFDNMKSADKRILFMGCSQTEGIGVPVEHTWANILLRKIRKEFPDTNIPYWNIGLAGCGYDSMTRAIYNLVDVLKPQLIFCLFPSPYRREIMKQNEFIRWLPASTAGIDPKFNQIFLEPDWVRYQTEQNLAMMDLILNNKVQVLWDSWFTDDNKPLEEVVSIGKLPTFQNKVKRSWASMRNVDLGRDGMHAGPMTNRRYADYIFEDHVDYIVKCLSSS
jgi:hypothetical protein